MLLIIAGTTAAQDLATRYSKERPVTIVCDWEKPPYEFLDDDGKPAGSNIDVMRAVMNSLHLPVRFVMKEWRTAIQTFEHGDADLILANAGRYREGPWVVSHNIVNYNRVCAAVATDTIDVMPLTMFREKGAVFKPGDYSSRYFANDSLVMSLAEYKQPKVALMGLLTGDFKYFIWGEEPIKWKIKELNLKGINIAEVDIPVSEIHIIGHDADLVAAVDNQYSLLKQSGEVETLQNRWFHPERSEDKKSPIIFISGLSLILLVSLCYFFTRLARAHVHRAARTSIELNERMQHALHTNGIDILDYDIHEDEATRLLRFRYNRLSDQPLIAMSFYDQNGNFVAANALMRKLCRFDDPDTERFWRTMSIFDIPAMRGIISRGNKTNLLSCSHLRYPEMDIDNYIENSIAPVMNDKGEIVYYFITAADVTNDRNHQWHLRQLQRQIRETHQNGEQSRKRLNYLLNVSQRKIEHTQAGEKRLITDTTSLTEARQRLENLTALARESARMKSAFMASMTHELRTPLNAIVGFAGILEALGDGYERAEFVRIIQNNSEMLQRLINDIIDVSSLATDAPITIEPRDVDFAAAFDDICVTLHTRLSETNIAFIKENPYTTLPARLDVERIQQVLTNFVINAAKFTEHGHIRLGYRISPLPDECTPLSASPLSVENTSGLYFYCEDTGRGIPKDKQQDIFQRFVKLDEFVQGTGMGLAICQNIVQLMGGHIGVKSEGLGHGSTFWIWIPLTET